MKLLVVWIWGFEELEPVCCKKQQKRFLTSYWFEEWGTSEDSKWYKIDPVWSRESLGLVRYNQFGIIQVLQRSPTPQTSNWWGTFFAVSYSKPALLPLGSTSLWSALVISSSSFKQCIPNCLMWKKKKLDCIFAQKISHTLTHKCLIFSPFTTFMLHLMVESFKEGSISSLFGYKKVVENLFSVQRKKSSMIWFDMIKSQYSNEYLIVTTVLNCASFTEWCIVSCWHFKNTFLLIDPL